MEAEVGNEAEVPDRNRRPRALQPPNLLRWPVHRPDRTFRVHVVEPESYAPTGHIEIFKAAIQRLVGGSNVRMDPYEIDFFAPNSERFDLVTFPEAFLNANDLVSVLEGLHLFEAFGCIHVGLHSGDGLDNHLFAPAALQALLTSLSAVAGMVDADLEPFAAWLGGRNNADRFNVACLFTLDAHQRVRVCLHPKSVRSRVEMSPHPELHMTEADLFTMVILQPVDTEDLTIVIQPLICSDALRLETDRRCRPMEGLTRHGLPPGTLPDHVDVVSVVACTPQVVYDAADRSSRRRWHEEFQDSFKNAARENAYGRHHFAAFVLANFRTMSKERPGGLSGIFIPVPLTDGAPPFVDLSAFGQHKDLRGDNQWSSADTDLRSWSTLGHIASLDPFGSQDAVARMFAFTIHRFPRDTSAWRRSSALTAFTVRYARGDDGQSFTFQE